MPTVMRLWGDALGRPTEHDNCYLKDMDFEANGGHGKLTVTDDLAEAKRFETGAEAFEFWRRSPECHPVRASDGRPNRPLTAWNWTFFDPDKVDPATTAMPSEAS